MPKAPAPPVAPTEHPEPPLGPPALASLRAATERPPQGPPPTIRWRQRPSHPYREYHTARAKARGFHHQRSLHQGFNHADIHTTHGKPRAPRNRPPPNGISSVPYSLLRSPRGLDAARHNKTHDPSALYQRSTHPTQIKSSQLGTPSDK